MKTKTLFSILTLLLTIGTQAMAVQGVIAQSFTIGAGTAQDRKLIRFPRSYVEKLQIEFHTPHEYATFEVWADGQLKDKVTNENFGWKEEGPFHAEVKIQDTVSLLTIRSADHSYFKFIKITADGEPAPTDEREFKILDREHKVSTQELKDWIEQAKANMPSLMYSTRYLSGKYPNLSKEQTIKFCDSMKTALYIKENVINDSVRCEFEWKLVKEGASELRHFGATSTGTKVGPLGALIMCTIGQVAGPCHFVKTEFNTYETKAKIFWQEKKYAE